MPVPHTKARLYVEHELGPGRQLPAPEKQAHYLVRVLRLRVNDQVGLFNGVDGEWTARLTAAGHGQATLECLSQVRRQTDPPDNWLLFAPLKKTRTDFVVEKATEIGVSAIIPVRTDFTNTRRVPAERLRQIAREAAEQCGGLAIPAIGEFADLPAMLDTWPGDRKLIFCDETRRGSADFPLPRAVGEKLAILIGPEGGFSAVERARLHSLRFVMPVSLGSRQLRAETAAVAALGLVNIPERAD